MASNHWREVLADQGYAVWWRNAATTPLRSILSDLEARVWRCQRMTAKAAADARSNTLSRRHGLGVLPLHSDGAALPIPPRFVLLAAPPWRAAPTHVLDLWPIFARLPPHMGRSLFRIDTGRKRYIQRLVDRPMGRPARARFNEDIMTPINTSADAAHAAIRAARRTAKSVHWSEARLLVIDNWRALHGRGAVMPATPGADVAVDFRHATLRRMAIWTED